MTEQSSSRKSLGIIIAVLVLAGIGGGVWWWLNREKTPESNVDWPKVYALNNEAIGWMDQFKYQNAAKLFAEVRKLAPEWFPGRINHAIALLNDAGGISPGDPREKEKKPLFSESLKILHQVIHDPKAGAVEKAYGHFCSGVIYKQNDNLVKLKEHMEQVTKLDPKAPGGWYYLGMAIDNSEPKRAAQCFETALKLAPYHSGIMGMLLNNAHVRENKEQLLERIRQRNEALRKNEVLLENQKERYTEIGYYAECIGQKLPQQAPDVPLPVWSEDDQFRVKLADGAKWASLADLKHGLHAHLRKQFGAVLVNLDFNRDKHLDVLMLNAVAESGKVRSLLLKNNGDSTWSDVTKEAGLHSDFQALACSVGDFTNDGYPDLILTGIGGMRLYQNLRDGTFKDVTKEAGLDTIKGVTLGTAFVDLDQDGDLDCFVSHLADSADNALSALKEGKPSESSKVLLLLNVAAAVLVDGKLSQDPMPLEPRFQISSDKLLQTPRLVTTFVVTDIDLDRDVDVVMLSANGSPEVILNDRVLQLRVISWTETDTATSALSLMGNHDEQADLLMLHANASPDLLLHEKSAQRAENRKEWFTEAPVNAPALRQAMAQDVDLDGWTDVVGLSSEGKPTLLRNQGGKLTQKENGLGADSSWPKDVVAISTGEYSGSALPDLMIWSESQGLLVRKNQGNGNRSLALRLSGHRLANSSGEIVRCNADGIGTLVFLIAQEHWAGQEYTTLSAGLGQSSQCMILGLGKHDQAQVLRLRWPDICWQGEMNIKANQCHLIHETNRKQGSCPLFFSWDGERFVFVTDFLGAGTMAEMNTDGTTRPPRPEESVKIESHQLKPKDGQYILKIAEPMNEATYLDRLQLLVFDHPPDVGVYPDERFATVDPQPTQDLLAFDKRIYPVKAVDHRNNDMTRTLRKWDRNSVDRFRWRTWLGFAEDHFVEMDFGEALKNVPKDRRLVLFLAGHTEYAYPESLFAAEQAGITPVAPTLEQFVDGKWQKIAELGFPAGMARMMTYDVTGKLKSASGRFRIRTNLQVFWDEIFFAPVERVNSEQNQPAKKHGLFRVTPLSVSQAKLYARAPMQEFSPDGRLPTVFDYHRLESYPSIQPVGMYTRFGEVTELLNERNDCFVIFGPGDEVDVRFDAKKLPPLPKGWTRSYVLKTWGYCKGIGPYCKDADRVGPLPFKGMTNFPYGPNEKYPDDELHRAYRKKYLTREVRR